MDALELILKDHVKLRKMLEDAGDARQRDTRETQLAELRAELAAHELMEEQVLYPALKRHERLKDLVLEGREEHHVADLLLDELMEVDAGTDAWKAKMEVLKESVEHHLEEEEDKMLDPARQLLHAGQLERMGAEMAAIKGAGPDPRATGDAG